MDVNDLRMQFPSLSEKVYGKPLIYFDNAASMQRPLSVVERIQNSILHENANIHRAVHYLSAMATDAYENTREQVARFLNASSRQEVVFTYGTTTSINLVAYSFGEKFIGEGDEIIVSEAEHHSNIVPWQLLCSRKGASLKVIPVLDNGELDLVAFKSLITPRTRLVSVTHISNVLGIVNPIDEVIRIAHEKGVPVLIDGAQGIVHQKIDVQALDCDFYCFSAHKIFGATGVGVLYGKRKWLTEMPPFLSGGEMIDTVKFSGSTYAPIPMRFEAGTQNFNSVPTLQDSISTINSIRESEELLSYHEKVKDYVYNALLEDSRIRLFGVPCRTSDKIALFSFCVEGVHHEDLALILDKMGIAVRSGQMCAEPIMDRFGVTGMLRASLSYYNTMEEAQTFIESLNRAITMLS